MKKIKLFLALIMISGFISAMFPVTSFAAGDVYVSTGYIEIPVGGYGGFYITADNAAGFIEWYGDGSAYSAGSAYLDSDGNPSTYVEVYGNYAGTTVIEITNIDVATYDSEELYGSNYVEVYVYEEEQQQEHYDTPSDDTPKTESDPESLKVMVGDETYYMLTDLTEIKVPEGFVEKDVTFKTNGQTVKGLTFTDENLTIYPLKKKSDNSISYFTYSEGKEEFKEVPYYIYNDLQYFFLNIPEQYQLPTGYKQAEVKINGFSVPSYVSEDEAMSGFHYVYGIANGKSGFFSYYEPDQTIQRCLDFGTKTKAVEKVETEPVKKDNKTELILIIALGVCFVLLIVFIILFVTSKKRNKKKEKKKTVESIYSEEESYEDSFDDEIEEESNKRSYKGTYKNSYEDLFDDNEEFLIRQAGKRKKDDYDYFNN